MELNLLIAAITGVVQKVVEWLKVAEELKDSEDAGGPVSAEVRARSKKARLEALSIMHAAKPPPEPPHEHV